MTLENEIHLDDIGTIFRLTITDETGAPVDVSSATVKKIYLRKPSAELLEKTAVFMTDGTDGVIQYVAVSGDLDEIGEWTIQAYVELTSWKGHSQVITFPVYENI